jgi:cell division septation protein DedD
MWVWIYCGIGLLSAASLVFLIFRKMGRSRPLSSSDCLVIASVFVNLVTLAIAVMALQMGIASYRDRKESGEDQSQQLQRLQTTLESLRQTLEQSVSSATQQLGNVQPPAIASASLPASKESARSVDRGSSARDEPPESPFLPPGTTVVQVAALVREADALALAEALHQRNFPAFVVEPQTDHFYRVQVGPYADIRSAKSVRQQLKSQGFESIIKHRGA